MWPSAILRLCWELNLWSTIHLRLSGVTTSLKLFFYACAGHSPFAYAERSLSYWLARGLPHAKAVLGVPFYERPTWHPYKDLVASDEQAADVDSIVYQGTTVHYNGVPTIKRKTELALERGGGVMIWHLSQDTVDDTSLLEAIHGVARARR